MASEKPITKYIGNLRGKGWLLLLAALGILLLLFGGGAGQSSSFEPESDLLIGAEEYRRVLEEELSALCRGVRGVGELDLLITLDGSESIVYATDITASGAKEYVTVGGSCVPLAREYPSVLGVAVVCDGGDNADVCRELTSLICAALGIGSNRVYISVKA